MAEVCHWMWALGFRIPKPDSVAPLFLLPADPDVKLTAVSPAPCLPACYHASPCVDNGLRL